MQAIDGAGGSPPVGWRAGAAGVARPGRVAEIDFGRDVGIAASVAAIAAEAVAAVGKARHALAAELTVSQLLGMVELAGPPQASGADRAAARAELHDALIGWAASAGTPEGLAFLRVAAVLGEPATRARASAEAERLAAAGVEDRRWAAIVGRPRLVRAWWYGDVFGGQESVNLLFGYAHREHCLCMLIDHRLGGGIKDCWISEGRVAAGLRARSAAQMDAEPTALFEDIDPHRAVQLLRPALGEPACPVQADQIQDLAANLEILRARVSLLTEQNEPVLTNPPHSNSRPRP